MSQDWQDVRLDLQRVYREVGPVKLARELGVHRNTVWEWEQDRARPQSRAMVMAVRIGLRRFVAAATRDED